METPQNPGLLMMLIAIMISLAMVAAMGWMRKRSSRRPTRSYLVEAMVGGPEIFSINATTRENAIGELAGHASRILRWPDEKTIFKGIMQRENQFPTGLEYGFAVPHARFVNLGRSLVLFARSKPGIEWECIDHKPARFIFMLLSPEENEEIQLKMLAEISRSILNPQYRAAVANAMDCREIVRATYNALGVR